MKYLLKSMQMARSTYYFELSKADQVAVRNHCLADEIKDIFSQHKGRYGVRRVYQELIKRGHKVNHKRVQRLMHTMGLAGKRPKEKYSSFETFAKAVDGYINYYNNERIQEKTKWMPPTKFREASMCT